MYYLLQDGCIYNPGVVTLRGSQHELRQLQSQLLCMHPWIGFWVELKWGTCKNDGFGSRWYVTAAEMHEGRLHVTKSAQTYHDAVLVRSPISTSVVTWVGNIYNTEPNTNLSHTPGTPKKHWIALNQALLGPCLGLGRVWPGIVLGSMVRCPPDAVPQDLSFQNAVHRPPRKDPCLWRFLPLVTQYLMDELEIQDAVHIQCLW